MAEHIISHQHHSDDSHITSSKTIFGFWLYLMTDCILFATFFATYMVLKDGTFGGPTAASLDLRSALNETLVLLSSSFACGLAQVAALKERRHRVQFSLIITFLLGGLFFWMVMNDFAHLIQQGNNWQRSAFLSAYFTLVGTLLMHIVCGLLWMIVLMLQILYRGLTEATHRRLLCLRLFWHFLNIVWIFIFTIVYLWGAA